MFTISIILDGFGRFLLPNSLKSVSTIIWSSSIVKTLVGMSFNRNMGFISAFSHMVFLSSLHLAILRQQSLGPPVFLLAAPASEQRGLPGGAACCGKCRLNGTNQAEISCIRIIRDKVL